MQHTSSLSTVIQLRCVGMVTYKNIAVFCQNKMCCIRKPSSLYCKIRGGELSCTSELYSISKSQVKCIYPAHNEIPKNASLTHYKRKQDYIIKQRHANCSGMHPAHPMLGYDIQHTRRVCMLTSIFAQCHLLALEHPAHPKRGAKLNQDHNR